ncbi:unnamed protein product [Alopecurus aequalis]
MLPCIPQLHLELHRGVEHQPQPDAARADLGGEARPRRVGGRRPGGGELPLHRRVALGLLVERVHDRAGRDELVVVVDGAVDTLEVDADLLVGVVLVDGERDRQVDGAGLAVKVGDGEVDEGELGAVRAEAEPADEEDDAGDEDEREQHRAGEVEAPDRRALPVVHRQTVVPRHG